MKLIVFIDYDNLLELQRLAGVLDIVTKALLQTPLDSAATRGTCDVRIYGGWYEGATLTRLAQDVSVAIHNEFPALVRVLGGARQIITFMTKAELAVALLEEPSHLLFNTYRRRGKPANIRIQSPATLGCPQVACPLPIARKLLKTGKCSFPTCTVTADDLVYRHEQKIVDTMLSCDLIYAAEFGYDRIILLSGDDDFLPPLRTALLRGAATVRFHPKPSNRPVSFPSVGGQLIEMNL